jgi:hypothetical protein
MESIGEIISIGMKVVGLEKRNKVKIGEDP